MLEPCEGAGPGLRPGPETEEAAPEGEKGRPSCEEDEQDSAQMNSDVVDRVCGSDGLEEDEDEAVSFSFCLWESPFSSPELCLFLLLLIEL